ncbi:MAG: P27 family phage terminase small subunit [Clostridia bacterium]|nr:P27 family phage terminase small subunit [Clostridia bacterium]
MASFKKLMQEAGTYRKEYDQALKNLTRMQKQYDVLEKKFAEAEYPFEVQTEQGSKKAPIVTTMEALRRDILAYMNALGFTPMGMKRLEGEKPTGTKNEEKDPFAEALEKLAAGSG